MDAVATNHHVLWLGDLNYRLVLGDYAEEDHHKHFEKVLGWIQAQDWKALYAHDELQQQLTAVRFENNFKPFLASDFTLVAGRGSLRF